MILGFFLVVLLLLFFIWLNLPLMFEAHTYMRLQFNSISWHHSLPGFKLHTLSFGNQISAQVLLN